MEKSSREIRLYPNRRLYDPVSARYVTFDHVYALVRDGIAITIRDAARGTDVTRRVLADLIIRQEMNATDADKQCFTTDFLRDLIRMGAAEQIGMTEKFLDHSIQNLR